RGGGPDTGGGPGGARGGRGGPGGGEGRKRTPEGGKKGSPPDGGGVVRAAGEARRGRASRSRRRGESMNKSTLRIGVLALQGDFALHARALEKCGAEAVEVRKPAELDQVDGLIMPGGESTTLLKLMAAWGLVAALEKFHSAGKPIFGTCAGLILLAREVESPKQFSLGLIDVSVERNAYGRQRESFEAAGTVHLDKKPVQL